MKTQETTVPFTLEKSDNSPRYIGRIYRNGQTATVYDGMGEFFLRAVNCHDELVKALETFISSRETRNMGQEPFTEKLRDLLKRARGEP
jgi:intergrase/recombinase